MVVLDRRTNTNTAATEIGYTPSPADVEIFGDTLKKVRDKAFKTLDDFADQVTSIRRKKTELENKIYHATTEDDIIRIMREMRSLL